ncbi:hypothetical protein BUW47_02570 [Limosilactobacillus fermentum]|uniref:Tape measure protein N-terminal domain-containing protein n=1 Tax=Limosilactobacillus fermentum TaxID=1613 RepID=A0A1L7GTT4_LIMFE|nr:tape measure protein [Limosilactobacillus fermentum]APU45393.1 hypothetical protein BUW47_02570 [Limosilactobacillus fermentum]
MADGKIDIDVIVNDQASESAKKIDDLLRNVGADAGDKAEENIKENVEKSESQVTNLIQRYQDIPKEIRTKLAADAKEQGIDNFDKLLKRIPKEQLTELNAKAKKDEVINYQELLRKLPAKVVTDVKLNDQATLPMKMLKQQSEETNRSFLHLRDTALGVFAGNMITSGLAAIKNGLVESAKAGMEYNIQQDRMKTVWTALTTEAPRDGKVLVDFINDMAQHSIYASETIDKMAQSFYHVHSSVKETKDWTNAFVRLGSTLHMSNDQLAEAGEQFAKIVAGGKASAEDMSVMINRFPMFGEALEKATGKSMKQLYAMSAAGKLTATQFTEALDYLSNKYKDSTKEAMTSFTGMSMYIKSRWAVLWGDVMNTSFQANKKMSEDLRDLLSDKMIARYSELLGQAMNALLSGVMSLLDYIGTHRKTLVDLIGNLGQLLGIVGQTVWQAFIDTIKTIGVALGLVKDNGHAAVDPLQVLDDVTKELVKHKTDVENFTKVLIAMFAVKKIMDFVVWMAKARDALLSFKIVESATSMLGAGGSVATAAGTGMLTAESAAANTGSVMAGGRFLATGASKFLTRGVPVIGAVAGVGSELLSTDSTSQKAGGSLGSVAGAGLGAAIGSAIAPGIGTAIGGMLGGELGQGVGRRLGEAISNGASSRLKAHPIEVHTKLKVDKDTSDLAKIITPTANKITQTVLRVGVDSQSIAKAKAQTDAYYNDLNKKVDNYYKNKEAKAQKDLQELVKNGAMSQVDADKRLANLQKSDQKAASAHKASYAQMQKDTNNYYNQVQKIESNGTNKLYQLAKKYGANSKQVEEEREKELRKARQDYIAQEYKDQVAANSKISKYVQQGADTQRKIYEKLVKDKGKLNLQDLKATQKSANEKYRAAVGPAKKARDEVVKNANAQYKETVNAAEKEYKENHTISKSKYEEIVRNAKKQRNGDVDAANDEYLKTTKKARDQHKKVTSEINKQKDEVIYAANAQATGHASAAFNEESQTNSYYAKGSKKTASIWNKLGDGINSVLKVFEASQTVPRIPGSYATGTGALPTSQLALVGEEGFELAHTPHGYELLGAGGPELRFLGAGTSILTHEQSKAAIAMNGGKIPGYAKGTGAKIEDFIDNVGDKLGDAFDLVGKSASEIWETIKKSTGIDRMISSLEHPYFTYDRGKGSIHLAADSVGNFIKKMSDKFMGKIGGSVSESLVKAAAAMMHTSVSGGDVSHILNVIKHESGGRANAINLWDSNAKKGTPSKGILQFIDSTFRKYAMPGHTNIWNPLDQLLAMFNDTSWRSDLTLGGWGPAGGRRFANGGWAFEPAIFGEVPGEPEVAINPRRNTADSLIAEAIQARAKVNPNGIAGKLSQLINNTKSAANSMMPVFATSNGGRASQSASTSGSIDMSGDVKILVQLDSNTIARTTYPKIKAIKAQEIIVRGNGGAIPVGNAMPVGGGV